MASKWSVGMAGAILSKAGTLRPGSVPNNITEDVITAWAEAVEMMDRPKITDLWKEAVTRWSVDEPNDRMFTPYSLRTAVLQTLERWERDADRRHELEQYRYDRMCERVRRGELPPGTEVGYEPQRVREARPDAIPAPSGAVKQVVGWRDRMGSNDE